jgi:hypothetical protein
VIYSLEVFLPKAAQIASHITHRPIILQNVSNVRFEALMVKKMTVPFFWVVTPCKLVGRY